MYRIMFFEVYLIRKLKIYPMQFLKSSGSNKGETLSFRNFFSVGNSNLESSMFPSNNRSMIQLVKYIMKSKINILVNCFILPWGPLFRLLVGVAYT